MQKRYQNITLETMSSHPKVASINNSIMMIDNLEKAIILSDYERESYFNTPFRYMSTMNLTLCVNGEMSFRLGLQEYEFSSGDALLLNSGKVCELTSMGDKVKFCSITLNEDIYRPNFTNHIINMVEHAFVKNPVCQLPPDTMTECVSLYRLIKTKLSQHEHQPLLDDIIKYYVQVLLATVCSAYILQEESHEPEGKLDRKQDLFHRFIELVQRDFMREHNIKYYANLLCITPRYLSQVVYQQSGHYASEHIDQYLMTEAKLLVRNQQYSILQISRMLGFTSLSFFGRYFKKFTGYSPTQYQELN